MKNRIKIIAALICVLIACVALTSCKEEEKPDYSWVKSLVNDEQYLQAEDEHSLWSACPIATADMQKYGTSPFLYKSIEGKLSVYSPLSDKIFLDSVENIKNYWVDNYSLFVVERESDGVVSRAYYDTYGNKVTEGSFGTGGSFDLNAYKYYRGSDSNSYIEYKSVLKAVGKADVEERFMFMTAGSALSQSLKLISAESSKDFIYQPVEKGGTLPNSLDVLEIPGYEGYTVSNYESVADEFITVVYDRDGNLVATTRIPNELEYEVELSDTTALYSKAVELAQGVSDYSYMEGSTPIRMEYYVANYMNGSLTKLDFPYKIIDGNVRYDYENYERSSMQSIVLYCRAFENGSLSNDTKYFLMNSDGSIKQDLTDNVKQYRLDVDKFMQIDENLYLAVGEDIGYVLDENLNKTADLNMKVDSVDYENKVIVGSIYSSGNRYYGSLDYSGKVVTEFVYSNISNEQYGSSRYKKAEKYNYGSSEYYLVDFATGASTKLGNVSVGAEEVYIGSNGKNLYYENSVKSASQGGFEIYYLEEKIYTLGGELLFTAKSGNYMTKSEAQNQLSNSLYEESSYTITSDAYKYVYRFANTSYSQGATGWTATPSYVYYQYTQTIPRVN